MHDGFVHYSVEMTISKDEYNALVKIKAKHSYLLEAIKKLQRYKVGLIDRHPSDSHLTPSMVPCNGGGFISFGDLANLTLSEEEIFERNMVSKIYNEFNRLIAEKEKLLNGK